MNETPEPAAAPEPSDPVERPPLEPARAQGAPPLMPEDAASGDVLVEIQCPECGAEAGLGIVELANLILECEDRVRAILATVDKRRASPGQGRRVVLEEQADGSFRARRAGAGE